MNKQIELIEGIEYLDMEEVEIMIFVSPIQENKNKSFFFNKETEMMCIRPNNVFVDIGAKRKLMLL